MPPFASQLSMLQQTIAETDANPMKPWMFLFAIVNAVLLFANIYLYNKLPPGVTPKLFEGWGALIAPLIVLMGVLWQTNVGFKNLIRSQNNQADINRQQTNDANEYKRSEQKRERFEQRAALLGALIAELRAGNEVLAALAKLCADLAETYKNLIGEKTQVEIPSIPKFEPVIYWANASKLDSLGAAAVGHLMQAYARLEKCMRMPLVKSDPQSLHLAFLGFEGGIINGTKAIEEHLVALDQWEKEFATALARLKSETEAEVSKKT